MKRCILIFVLSLFTVAAAAFAWAGEPAPDSGLKVVIIRHGEKPKAGDNLSCQGHNRALQLPAVLYQKFMKPDYTYVPSLGRGESTSHARMFQTVTPFAVKHNLVVNSSFGRDDYANVTKSILDKTGTVLVVWEHHAIEKLAGKLGVANPPTWEDDDFDSIWIITYLYGKADLSFDREGITPSSECRF